MFKRNEISTFAWIVLLVVLSIPILNVIVGVILYLDRKTNRTVKNFFNAFIVLWLLAMIGLFNGVFDNLLGLFG